MEEPAPLVDDPRAFFRDLRLTCQRVVAMATIDADKSALRRGWARSRPGAAGSLRCVSGIRSTLSFRSRACLRSSADDRRARSAA